MDELVLMWYTGGTVDEADSLDEATNRAYYSQDSDGPWVYRIEHVTPDGARVIDGDEFDALMNTRAKAERAAIAAKPARPWVARTRVDGEILGWYHDRDAAVAAHARLAKLLGDRVTMEWL